MGDYKSTKVKLEERGEEQVGRRSVEEVHETERKSRLDQMVQINDFNILSYLSSQSGGFNNPRVLIDRFNDLKFKKHDHNNQLDENHHTVRDDRCRELKEEDFNFKPDDEFNFYEASDQLKSIFFNQSDCIRRKLWSFALGVQSKADSTDDTFIDKGFVKLLPHRDEDQVNLDVNRSFVYYPANISNSKKLQLCKLLSQTIIKILRKFQNLSYFQGYHDIVSIFLLNFIKVNHQNNSKIASKSQSDDEDDDVLDQVDNISELDMAIQRFTLHRIRDSLYTDLSPIMGYLHFTQIILSLERPDLASVVALTSDLPIFSLSWILTLTSHDLTSFETVSRLFDFLICHDPIMICYLASAICLTKEKEIEELMHEARAAGEEIDLDMVHFVMSKLPVLVLEEGSGKEKGESSVEPILEDSEQSKENEYVDKKKISDENSLGEEEDDDDKRNVEESEISDSSRAKENLEHNRIKKTSVDKRSISVETIIQSSIRLFKIYPPTEPRLGLKDILGPKSCINTWKSSQLNELNDYEAEKILVGPKEEIVRAREKKDDRKNRKYISILRFMFSNSRLMMVRMISRMKILRKARTSGFFIFGTSILFGIITIGYSNRNKIYSLISKELDLFDK